MIGNNMVIEGGVLARFFDCAPMALGVVEIVEGDFIFHSVNETAAATCNRTVKEMTGKKASEVDLSPQMISLFLENAAKTRETGGSVRYDYCRTIDGVEHWRRATLTPVDSADSSSPYYCF